VRTHRSFAAWRLALWHIGARPGSRLALLLLLHIRVQKQRKASQRLCRRQPAHNLKGTGGVLEEAESLSRYLCLSLLLKMSGCIFHDPSRVNHTRLNQKLVRGKNLLIPDKISSRDMAVSIIEAAEAIDANELDSARTASNLSQTSTTAWTNTCKEE